MASDRLLVFAKRPAAGRVKPRLTPPLTPADAAVVYEACLRDIVTQAARERGRVEIWYEGGTPASGYFDAEFAHLPRFGQAPGDTGAKLHNAFAYSFASGAERAVVIGSDSPTLPEGVLTAAFSGLRDADAVFAPTRAGGYCLVGARAQAWPRAGTLFREMPSSPDPFRSMLERAIATGLDIRILPGWYEIDRLDDLRRARDDVPPDSHLGRWLAGATARGYIDP